MSLELLGGTCARGLVVHLVILLAYTTCVIVTTYDQFEVREVLYLFLMSIWLLVGCFPLFWLFSLVVALKFTFIRLKPCIKDNKGWKKAWVLFLLMPSTRAMRFFSAINILTRGIRRVRKKYLPS